MKKIIFLALIILFTQHGVFAQEFEVPKNYVLENAEDYKKYEKDVIACHKWMMATPFNEQQEKRKEAFTFIMAWIGGTEDVTIEINQRICTFMENPDLVILFIGGWITYTLETNDASKYMGSLKGLESTIEYYEKNKAFMKRDKNAEKYVKMKESGTLEGYVKKNT